MELLLRYVGRRPSRERERLVAHTWGSLSALGGPVAGWPRQRSYRDERNGSRQFPAFKPCRVWLVPWWVTAWEYQMLLAYIFYFGGPKRVDWEAGARAGGGACGDERKSWGGKGEAQKYKRGTSKARDARATRSVCGGERGSLRRRKKNLNP